MAEPTPEAPAARRGLLRRVLDPLERRLGKRFAAGALAGALALVAAAGGGAVMWAFSPKATTEEDDPIQAALAALDAGDLAATRRAIARVKPDAFESDETQAAVFFALGASLQRDAEGAVRPGEKSTLHATAARLLDESKIRGGVPGRSLELNEALGRSQLAAGQSAEALSAFEEALSLSPTPRPDLELLAARCAADLDPPELDRASIHVARALAEPDARPSDAHSLRAEIALRAGRLAEARESLAQCQDEDPRVLLLRAVALERSISADGDREATFEEALALLRRIPLSEIDRPLAAETRFHMARCQIGLGDPAAAEAEFSRCRQFFADTPHGFAAVFEEAKLASDRGAIAEAGALIQFAMTNFQPSTLSSRALAADEAARRLVELQNRWIAAGRFEEALSLCDAPPELLSPVRAAVERCRILSAAAEDAQRKADTAPRAETAALAAIARSRWRAAGEALWKLSEIRADSRQTLDDLSAGARRLAQGQNYVRALVACKEHFRLDPQRRDVDVLLVAGESHLALGDAEAALAHLNEAIERFPRHPELFRARLLAAAARRETGDFGAARELALENLRHDSLSPRSSEWRDSQFLLGELWHQQGRRLESESQSASFDPLSTDVPPKAAALMDQAVESYIEATVVLEAALERYPKAPRSLLARYLLGECHRRAAKHARRKLQRETLETVKNAQLREMRARLESAVAAYDRLLVDLAGATDPAGDDPLSAALLRDAFFAKGECLFQLEKWDDARKVFAAATSRWQYEPVAIEAYVRLAACHRRMNRVEEARSALEQARVALDRIREDRDFEATTRWSRDEWRTQLEWMARG